MSYPIYNDDYPFSLSEIVRYLKTYHHIIRKKPSNSLRTDGVFYTDHFYKDGLIIRLFWKEKNKRFRETPELAPLLFRMQSQGGMNLKGYIIISYSSNTYTKTPSTFESDRFFDFVIKDRNQKTYSKDKYKKLEFNNVHLNHSEDVFLELEEKINNVVEFEEYLRNKNKSH